MVSVSEIVSPDSNVRSNPSGVVLISGAITTVEVTGTVRVGSSGSLEVMVTLAVKSPKSVPRKDSSTESISKGCISRVVTSTVRFSLSEVIF